MTDDNMKSPEEASEQFHNIMKASVSRVNPLDPNAIKLYLVTFDNSNNPVEAKLAPLNSGKGHGLSNWNKKTLFTNSVYVNALNEKEAFRIAKEIADNRLERG